MSSLQRYKKSGGFFQLLSLIETFGPQKREKFVDMIEAESPAWAQALREKMLSLERIFNWPDQVLIEVFKRLPPKSMAFALQGLKEEQKGKITQFFSASEQRRIADVLTEGQPKPEEIAATMVKLVELTRRMIHDREIHPEKFDEALLIPEEFESKIESLYGLSYSRRVAEAQDTPAVKAAAAAVSAGSEGSPPASLETAQLQRTLGVMLKENKALKDEVRALREKLDQIKRIA